MRKSGFCLLLTVLLVLPGTVSARQDGGTEGKEPNRRGDLKLPRPAEGENLQVLEDVKSGLQPQAASEFQKDDEPEFVREMVRVQWRTGDPIDLYVLRPKTSGKVPIVLYLYSYPGDSAQFRDNGWGKRATEKGFAAVGFASALTGERYHLRPMKEWFVSELPESLGSTVHDVQLILNYLTERGDMDMEHVGMIGIGSGATIAILAAHADPRIKVLDLLDPWGDWPDWLRESPAVPDEERAKYTTPEFLKSVAKLDPVAYLPSLKTPLRLRQMLSEPVMPKSAMDRVATSLRDQRLLVRYANAEVLEQSWQVEGFSGWIKQLLRTQMQAEGRTGGPTAPGSNSAAN